jgi:hypothetical protein
MTAADAQQDLRRACYSGAPGVVTPAFVWFAAGLTAVLPGSQAAGWILLSGGMLMSPRARYAFEDARAFGVSRSRNPVGPPALQGTVWVLLTPTLAYKLSVYRALWFFPRCCS